VDQTALINPQKTVLMNTKAYAALDAVTPLVPFSFDRRQLREDDVQVQILYCGVCHSDLHQVRNEWNNSIYPMVPATKLWAV
jgi:uncharacterized zinc-type alcohol dehydrogenase-like protein